MLSILYGGGGLGLYCPFFFFLKGCEDNLALVQLPESRLCLEFISLVPAAGHFLRVAVIHRTQALGTEVPVSKSDQVVVPGNVHKTAALFQAHVGSWGQPEP